MSLINGNVKIVIQFVYVRLHYTDYITDCLMSPIVTDGKDGDGLQLEKVGQLFQVLTPN